MLRRIPVSLRFDDEDSDFYYGFIEQKKNDRELSTLILNLLHVYHENEYVRNAVEEYTISKSPFVHIQKEIERIALEHSKNTVSAGMLDDFTKVAKKSVMNHSDSDIEKQNEQEILMLTSLDMQQKMENQIKGMVQSALQEMFKEMSIQNEGGSFKANERDKLTSLQNSSSSSQEIIVPPIVNTEEVVVPIVTEQKVDAVSEQPKKKTKLKSFNKMINSLDNK